MLFILYIRFLYQPILLFIQLQSFLHFARAKADSSEKCIFWQQNPDSDWWLQIENINVGYWPKEIFSAGRMKDQFTTGMDWGGETYSLSSDPHVQMGNGRFGSEGTHNVRNEVDIPAHHALLTYLVSNNQGGFDVFEADHAMKMESDPALYNANIITHQPSEPGLAGGTWIFFGGPGTV